MSKIERIQARTLLDSRGYPALEVDVYTSSGAIGRASIPSGASTGLHEAVELRDQDPKRFHGKGLDKAIDNIHRHIAPAIVGRAVSDQQGIDDAMCALDGTPNKGRLGANALLGVSLAVAQAAAEDTQKPLYAQLNGSLYRLPVPLINILNGGQHADNRIDIQEFMIVPLGAPSFREAMRAASEVFHCLRDRLKKGGYSTNVGDEGGFAPNMNTNEAAMDAVLAAIEHAGYRLYKDIAVAIDAASSSFYDQKTHTYRVEDHPLDSEQMIEYWHKWAKQYPIFSLEDPMAEDDWKGWQALTRALKDSGVQLVGDDLFVTNKARLARGIDMGVANAILVKPNQIGTLTETCQVIQYAHQHHYQTIMSHRSGETEDCMIADLAVGLNTPQIKTGSVARAERTAKYNQLMRIEEAFGTKAQFAGHLYLDKK